MPGIFTISPVNSLSFVRSNTLLPSFDNTLYQNLQRVVSKVPYCQMIQVQDTITLQVKTDFTSVAASIYNVATGAMTSLTPTIASTYTNYSFWNIPVTFSTLGYFKIFVSGTLSGYSPVTYNSEMIEVRSSWDGVLLNYYNSVNTIYVDYSTGIQHQIRAFGFVKFSDVGGTDEYYNNFGVEERVYAENQTIYELYLEGIPYYLCKQIIYGSKLDNFYINNVPYLVTEHTVTVQSGSHNYDLVLKMMQQNVTGINNDFQSNIQLS